MLSFSTNLTEPALEWSHSQGAEVYVCKCWVMGKVCKLALWHLRQDGLDDSAHLHESDVR